MSILSELNEIMLPLDVPVETAVFSGKPPDTYIVLTPLIDTLECFADNKPLSDIHEVRLSLFTKKNYLTLSENILTALLNADFTVTERRYIGREEDTGFHNYAIDVAKNYDTQEENI